MGAPGTNSCAAGIMPAPARRMGAKPTRLASTRCVVGPTGVMTGTSWTGSSAVA